MRPISPSMKHYSARHRRRMSLLSSMEEATQGAVLSLAPRAPKIEVYTLRPPGALPFIADYNGLTDEAFRTAYRFNKVDFTTLLELCKGSSFWKPPQRTSHIPQAVWLGMVLEQLGTGATSRSLERRHRVSGYSAHRGWVMDSIIDALSDHEGARISFPDLDDDDAWHQLARGFVSSIDENFPCFYGTVAAADGTLIKIEPTGVTEMRRQAFRSRKVERSLLPHIPSSSSLTPSHPGLHCAERARLL